MAFTPDQILLVVAFGMLALVLIGVGLVVVLDSSFDSTTGSSAAPAPSNSKSLPSEPVSRTSPLAAPAWRGARGGEGRRVYTNGTRLDELLRWPALDAAVALKAYVRQMDWEDKETLLTHLPQVTNCILGLDTAADSGAGRGWLNEQANLLHEGPGRNVKAAAALQAALLDLLAAPAAGAAGGAARGGGGGGGGLGMLLERLLEAGAGGRDGDLAPSYTFFARQLPAHSRLAVSSGRYDLLPPLFRERLQQAPPPQQLPPPPFGGASQAAGGGGLPPAGLGLVLPAWEYYLYCFCLWPLSELGGRSLEDHKPPSSVAAAASTAISALASGAQPGAATDKRPLYLQLLDSYLHLFAPPDGQPLSREGERVVEAFSQFWLCQNAPRAAPAPACVITSAASLQCLSHLVHRLNLHEAAFVAAGHGRGMAADGSAHAQLARPLLDFYQTQLKHLPDISARVVSLIQLLIRFLQPWDAPPRATPAPSASPTPAPAAASAAAAAAPPSAASSLPPLLRTPSKAKERGAPLDAWRPFICRYFVPYAVLLKTTADEVCASRFDFADKRHVAMLREVVALFETPLVLPLLRTMAEAAELLLKSSAPRQFGAAWQCEVLWGWMEGEGAGWRTLCEALTPGKLYKSLEEMDTSLQAKAEGLRKRERTGLSSVQNAAQRAQRAVFAETGAAATPQAVMEQMRQLAQQAMRALQQSGQEPLRPAVSSQSRPLLQVVEAAPAAERAKLLRGEARCSSLSVPFRATPRQPDRPADSHEVGWLVDLAEAAAARMPKELLDLGIHPRLLASRHALLLISALPPLLALQPSSSERPLLLALVWWPLLLVALAVGFLLWLRFARLHRPPSPAVGESWVPWAVAQLSHGASEADVRNALREQLGRAAGGSEAGLVDSVVAAAQRRARFE